MKPRKKQVDRSLKYFTIQERRRQERLREVIIDEFAAMPDYPDYSIRTRARAKALTL